MFSFKAVMWLSKIGKCSKKKRSNSLKTKTRQNRSKRIVYTSAVTYVAFVGSGLQITANPIFVLVLFTILSFGVNCKKRNVSQKRVILAGKRKTALHSPRPRQ